MKKRLRSFKILLIACIFILAVTFLPFNSTVILCCLCSAVLILLYLFTATFQIVSKFEDAANTIITYRQKLRKNEEFCESLNRKIDTYRTELTEKTAEISSLREIVASHENDKLNTASLELLSLLNDNVVAPYISFLKAIEMPLSDKDRQTVIDMTVNIAMIAVDLADTYDWDINNRDEQKLNCEIVKGTLTRDEALAGAIVVTSNPTVTPKWIRALSGALKSIISDESGILFSGYKLNYNHEEN